MSACISSCIIVLATQRGAYYYDRQQTPGWERLGEQKQREIDNIFRDYLKQN